MKLFQKKQNKTSSSAKEELKTEPISPDKMLSNKITLANHNFQKGLIKNVVELLEPNADILDYGENLSNDHFELLDKLITAEFITGRYDKASHFAEILLDISGKDPNNLQNLEISAKALFFLGLISLKKAELKVSLQCFENAIEMINNSELNLPFILLAQLYLSAAITSGRNKNFDKMVTAFQNFDGIISGHQNNPEFIVLGLLKEANKALYSFRLGYYENIKLDLEFFSNYCVKIKQNYSKYVVYYETFEKAVYTLNLYYLESKQPDLTLDNYLFSYSLAITENPALNSPTELVWINSI